MTNVKCAKIDAGIERNGPETKCFEAVFFSVPESIFPQIVVRTF